MSSFINGLSAASLAVYNAQVPGEGPKCVPLSLDFTVQPNGYTLDGQSLLQLAHISMVQTLWIDASNANAPLVVIVGGAQQVVVAKNGTQGYYPVICPNPFKFQFTCADVNAKVQVTLLNVPVAPGQWQTA